jgi:hypothetical protein
MMTSKNWKSDKACGVNAKIKTWFIMKYDGLHTLSCHQKEQKDLVYPTMFIMLEEKH